MIRLLLERWAEAQAVLAAIAADPARASELPAAAAACEAAGDAWVRALLFGGSMRERYGASPSVSRRYARERFARALDDAADDYAVANAAAWAVPDPVAREIALVAARAAHDRAVAVAMAVAYAGRRGS